MVKTLKTFLLISLLLTSHHFQAMTIIASGGSSVRIGSSSHSDDLTILVCFVGIIGVLVITLVCLVCSDQPKNAEPTKQITPSEKEIKQIIDLENENIDSINISGIGTLTIQQATDNQEKCTITAPINILPLLLYSISNNCLYIWQEPNTSFSSAPLITYFLTLKNIKKVISSGCIEVITDTSNQKHISSEKLSLNVSGCSNLTMPICVKKLTVHLTGSSNATLKGLAEDYLRLKANGNSDAKIDINTTEITAELTSDSKVTLSGKTNTQNITCSGCSDYKAGNLCTNTATVCTQGSSDAIIWAEELLLCSASGSSDIRYKGNPEIRKTKSGCADIKRLKLK